MVSPGGFEPSTHSLEGCCSIQLSYGPIMEQVKGIEPSQSAWKAEVLPLNYTCMTCVKTLCNNSVSEFNLQGHLRPIRKSSQSSSQSENTAERSYLAPCTRSFTTTLARSRPDTAGTKTLLPTVRDQERIAPVSSSTSVCLSATLVSRPAPAAAGSSRE